MVFYASFVYKELSSFNYVIIHVFRKKASEVERSGGIKIPQNLYQETNHFQGDTQKQGFIPVPVMSNLIQSSSQLFAIPYLAIGQFHLRKTESNESSVSCTKPTATELFSSVKLSCSVSKLTVDQRITFTLLNA